MRQRWLYGIVAAAVICGGAYQLTAETPDQAARRVKDQISQLRDGMHAGHVYTEEAKKKFNKGAKSCASCHGKDGKGPKMSLVGAFTKMPRYYKDINKVADLDLRIKSCIENSTGKKLKGKKARKKVKPLAFYVASLSNGMRLNLKRPSRMKGKEKAMFNKGKRMWQQKSGKRDFSCWSCHVKNAGKRIRLQGLLDMKKAKSMKYWPAYRFGGTKYWTVEDRIRGCYKQMKIKPKPKYFKKDIIAVEMYMFHLSRGGKVAIPGLVR